RSCGWGGGLRAAAGSSGGLPVGYASDERAKDTRATALRSTLFYWVFTFRGGLASSGRRPAPAQAATTLSPALLPTYLGGWPHRRLPGRGARRVADRRSRTGHKRGSEGRS